MKLSFLLSVALSGWIAFFYSQRGVFVGKFSDAATTSLFNLPNQNSLQNIQVRRINIKSPIKHQLYNSISEGMSYDEVRSILGWDGILIYQNDINYGDTHIDEKIYQWNNHKSENVGEMNPYWSVTLQFQNNTLVGKTDYNLQR
ncbi:MAG: hypothetical protein AAF349_13805 [Cyanobacteria bacterium P01_A01_bin.68]